MIRIHLWYFTYDTLMIHFTCTVMSDSLRPHELQHTRPPCPTPTQTYFHHVREPSSHHILFRPLFFLPPIPPSIRYFYNESTPCMRWRKYWSFSFSISPSNVYPGLIPLGWTDCISLQSKGLSRVFSNTTAQKHQFFSAQLPSQSNSHIHIWLLEKP